MPGVDITRCQPSISVDVSRQHHSVSAVNITQCQPSASLNASHQYQPQLCGLFAFRHPGTGRGLIWRGLRARRAEALRRGKSEPLSECQRTAGGCLLARVRRAPRCGAGARAVAAQPQPGEARARSAHDPASAIIKRQINPRPVQRNHQTPDQPTARMYNNTLTPVGPVHPPCLPPRSSRNTHRDIPLVRIPDRRLQGT